MINRITNANVYLNGLNLIGSAEEIDLPQPKAKMIEHKGLGLWGAPKFPAGLDEMTAKIKWSSLYSEVLMAAFLPFGTSQIMVRADLQQFGPGGLAAELPVVAMMTALFHEMPSFKVVKQENSDSQSALTVYYYLLNIGGVPQVEIDVMANVYKVLGIDQLAQFRMNIGG